MMISLRFFKISIVPSRRFLIRGCILSNWLVDTLKAWMPGLPLWERLMMLMKCSRFVLHVHN